LEDAAGGSRRSSRNNPEHEALFEALDAVFEKGSDTDELSNDSIMQALEAFTKRPGRWKITKVTQVLNKAPWNCGEVRGTWRGRKNLKLRVNAQAPAAAAAPGS